MGTLLPSRWSSPWSQFRKLPSEINWQDTGTIVLSLLSLLSHPCLSGVLFSPCRFPIPFVLSSPLSLLRIPLPPAIEFRRTAGGYASYRLFISLASSTITNFKRTLGNYLRSVMSPSCECQKGSWRGVGGGGDNAAGGLFTRMRCCRRRQCQAELLSSTVS